MLIVLPTLQEQKINNFLTSGKDSEDLSKRAAAMWFGPRLGKRCVDIFEYTEKNSHSVVKCILKSDFN